MSDVAGVIHRIAITVEEELNSETTPKYQTTEGEATTKYETTKSETTFKTEGTTPQSTADFSTEEISSSIAEINDEISLEKQLENETNLLKAELDASENKEDETPEEIILVSSIANIPEVNSELFSTIGSQDEDIQTNEATTESSFQTDFSGVTEIAVPIEEVEKETNEIKKFRSLYSNGTEDESKSEKTESIEIKNDPSDEDISDKSKNSDVEEQTQSTKTEASSEFKEENESGTFKTTETSLLSDIPEDKIAEFLISLKKTSTKTPNTDAPNSDSTTISFENLDNNPSEINVDGTMTEIKKETMEMDDQETLSTVTSNDAQQSLVKAFNDLVDSNENRESVILTEEVSTSQEDESVDLSTNKNVEWSTSIQTSTPGQTTQQSGIVDHSTESITESYKITENETSISDKKDENDKTPLSEEIQ